MNPLNKDCQKCPELVRSRKLYSYGKETWGYGKSPCQIMFIGEAPGRWGCGITGIPFTKDRSGEFFQRCLEVCELTKEAVYVTNIVKCCPEKNRTPSDLEVANCTPYLLKEIEKVNPTYIITLGAPATRSFVSGSMHQLTKDVYNWQGKRILMPMYHPAYALRIGNEKGYRENFKFRIETILKITEGGL